MKGRQTPARIGIPLLILSLAAAAPAARAVDLRGLLDPASPLWEQSQEDVIESVLAPGRFRRGNPSRSTHCTLGDVPVNETLLAWNDEGRLSGVRLIVVTRADVRGLTLEELERVQAECEAIIKTWTGTAGEIREERVRHAQTQQQEWVLSDRIVRLVTSRSVRHVVPGRGELVPGRAEFVRLDILPVPSSAAGEKTGRTEAGSSPGEEVSLTQNVERKPNGDVVITGIPMVDQGQRGYCAVSTITRVMMYYGMDADQHELAQLAGSSPDAGTSTDEMMDVLRRSGAKLGITSRQHLDLDMGFVRRLVQLYNQIARRNRANTISIREVRSLRGLYKRMNGEFLVESRMRQRAEYNRFVEAIHQEVEKGVPLAWSLILGKVPEEGETPQRAGGHMRLIIGYNDKTEELIFSDSWGAGHEAKRIRMDHAWAVTTGLYTIEPR